MYYCTLVLYDIDINIVLVSYVYHSNHDCNCNHDCNMDHYIHMYVMILIYFYFYFYFFSFGSFGICMTMIQS